MPAVVLMATRGSCGLAERSTPLVVGNLAAVGGAQGNALGAVVRRAATERDHEVALLGLQLRQPGAHIATVGLGWVPSNTTEAICCPASWAWMRRHAELAEHGVGNDQRLAKP